MANGVLVGRRKNQGSIIGRSKTFFCSSKSPDRPCAASSHVYLIYTWSSLLFVICSTFAPGLRKTTSVGFYQTRRRFIPIDITLPLLRFENLNSDRVRVDYACVSEYVVSCLNPKDCLSFVLYGHETRSLTPR
jgi:hypothetical protein